MQAGRSSRHSRDCCHALPSWLCFLGTENRATRAAATERCGPHGTTPGWNVDGLLDHLGQVATWHGACLVLGTKQHGAVLPTGPGHALYRPPERSEYMGHVAARPACVA